MSSMLAGERVRGMAKTTKFEDRGVGAVTLGKYRREVTSFSNW